MVEAKTSNPDLYSRLGVEDVDAGSGTGVLLEIDGPTPPTPLAETTAGAAAAGVAKGG